MGYSLALSYVKAPKNGYVYVSNQSAQTVYFDNMQVGVKTGNIIEEDHYYAYGLKIAGISSKKLGDAFEGNLKNNNLYNDKELFDDGDINWYDYGYRNYDPQIGRFVEVDPLTDDYAGLSPYHYAGNDPITNIDKDGLGIESLCPGASVFLYRMTNALSAVLPYAEKGLKGAALLNEIGRAGGFAANITTRIEIIHQVKTKSVGGAQPTPSPLKKWLLDRWKTFKDNWNYVGNSIVDFSKARYIRSKENLKPGSHYWKVVIHQFYDPQAPFIMVGGGIASAELQEIKGVAEALKMGEESEVQQLSNLATKNPSSSKVIFGKYIEGSSDSYNIRAGKDFVYFQLDNWEDLLKSVGGDEDAIWKINKQFIDDQWKAGKEFFFSHDPNTATGFYKKEIDYMKDTLGVKEFKKIGDNLWQAIR